MTKNMETSENYLFFTVQPLGIPLVPEGHELIPESLVNDPDELTLLTQFCKQLVAEISVARQVMDDKLEQPLNILE